MIDMGNLKWAAPMPRGGLSQFVEPRLFRIGSTCPFSQFRLLWARTLFDALIKSTDGKRVETLLTTVLLVGTIDSSGRLMSWSLIVFSNDGFHQITRCLWSLWCMVAL